MKRKRNNQHRSAIKVAPKTKKFRKRHPQIGAKPGTLVFGETSPEPKIQLIRFSHLDEKLYNENVTNINSIKLRLKDGVSWVDVQGFGNKEKILQIATVFGIHPLALEDIINIPQRPKTEIYGNQVLIVSRMISLNAENQIQTEQVTILLGSGYVVTFQEKYGDILGPLRKRIDDPDSKIRKEGSDFLMYAIVDSIVDGYYPIIELLGDHLEILETKVLDNPSISTLVELNQTKNMLVNLRRVVWPQREAINSLLHDEDQFVSNETKLFLRDTRDHCIQSAEVIEMYREMVTGMINIYLSSVANRSNEVMKVLTVMSSIFIPLTFLAGIYGMNFEYMPELKIPWSYPAILFLMLMIATGMFIFFKAKGWIRR